MKKTEAAEQLFREGYNCSQAVIAACGPDLGVDRDLCLRLAAPFGGGVCRSGGACGAVTGALMVIGLRHGGITVTDPSRKGDIYARGQDFFARFRARHGALVCRDLLGCDISTPAGAQQAREQNLHEERCAVYVRDAVDILDQMP